MTALEILNQWFEHMTELSTPRSVLCEARCESGKGPGTCPTCGTVYTR